MATKKKAAETVDYSVQEKISALYDLQQIDSKIDEINKLKGELPLEVQDLEDEVAGLGTRIANIATDMEELRSMLAQRKDDVQNSLSLIAKYEEQIRNVRNNREFDSLTKEIEYQRLEIELSEKRLREYDVQISGKGAAAEDAKAALAEREVDLQAKRAELESIEQETAEEMDALRAQEALLMGRIDERLLTAYKRIRANANNGLAVVTVKRDACGGCFNGIPPQRRFEIMQARKIIVCEYCGRILVADPSEAFEE